MIAYVALQLRRWLRRPLGVGFLLAPLIMAGIFSAPALPGRPSEPQGLRLFYEDLVILLGALAVGNQLAAVIEEEARLRRSSLLRLGELDGWRAVASFTLFGFILSLAFGTLGFVGPILAGLLVGISATSWAPDILGTTLALTGMCPVAILSGFLFPRPLSLLIVSGVALLGGIIVVSVNWSLRQLGYLAILHAVAFVLLSVLWRRQSSSRW